MVEIKKLVADYEAVKQENFKRQINCAQKEKLAEVKDLFERLFEVGNEIKSYINKIEIEFDLIDGAGKFEKFVLVLRPELDPENDEYLFGYWKNDKVDGTYHVYSLNPSYNHNSRVVENEWETKYFIPANTTTFVQIYGQKEYVIDLMKKKVVNILKKRIEVEKKIGEVTTNI